MRVNAIEVKINTYMVCALGDILSLYLLIGRWVFAFFRFLLARACLGGMFGASKLAVSFGGALVLKNLDL